MSTLCVRLFLALVLSNDVFASQAKAPALLGRAPEPTAAPDTEFLRRNILKHRAVTADGFHTCGFVSGIASSALTCNPGYTCTADSSIDGSLTYSNFGCCSTDNSRCTQPLTCYGSTHYWSITTALNSYETACPASTAPVCKVLYESGFEAFDCGTDSSTEYVQLTATGGSGASATSSPGSPSSSPSGSSPIVSSSASPPSAGSSTTAPAATSTSTLPVAPGQTSAAPITATSSALSTGAIVGIAVAGAAVLLAAIFGIGCVCWQRNRRRQEVAIVPNIPPSGPTPAMTTTPASAPAGHGPAVFTNVEPSSFNTMSQPNKEDYRFSGSTVAGDHYSPVGGKIENMPPLRPVDAVGEVETGSNVMSNAGHTVTSVASEGYNPPRV